MRIELHNIQATKALAQKFASHLKTGDIVLLYGDYGVGKTAFSRFLIQSWLGVDETYEVPSPSFAIVQEYENEARLLRHVDFYRLNDSFDVIELGYPEHFEDAISLIEWPRLVEEMLPTRHLKITMSEGANDTRQMEIEPNGDWDWIGLLNG